MILYNGMHRALLLEIQQHVHGFAVRSNPLHLYICKQVTVDTFSLPTQAYTPHFFDTIQLPHSRLIILWAKGFTTFADLLLCAKILFTIIVTPIRYG